MFRGLDAWARAAAGRGEVMFPLDVLMDERNVFAPDLLWFEDGHVLADDSPSAIPGIAVEVRSPSTWRYDIGAALELEAHDTLESPRVPGFALSVGTLIDG